MGFLDIKPGDLVRQNDFAYYKVVKVLSEDSFLVRNPQTYQEFELCLAEISEHYLPVIHKGC